MLIDITEDELTTIISALQYFATGHVEAIRERLKSNTITPEEEHKIAGNLAYVELVREKLFKYQNKE